MHTKSEKRKCGFNFWITGNFYGELAGAKMGRGETRRGSLRENDYTVDVCVCGSTYYSDGSRCFTVGDDVEREIGEIYEE